MKLIDLHQEILIKCDNPSCDFEIPNPTGDPNQDVSKYINVLCPKCSQNLLTPEDYENAKRFMNYVNWINKYFGWLSFFFRKKKTSTMVINVHKGFNIYNEDGESTTVKT